MTEQDGEEDLIRVVSQITAAVTNTTLYSAGHPQVRQYVDKAYALLGGLLQTKPDITLLLIGDELVAGNRPLPADSAYVVNFSRILRKKSIERVSFVAGVKREEVGELIRSLAASDTGTVRSSSGVKLGRVELRVAGHSDEPARAADAGGLEELARLTAAELEELKAVYLSAKRHRRIDIRGVDEMVKGFIRGFRQELNPLGMLAALKSVHEYTFTHVTNVCILTMAQAESLGFGGQHLHGIGVASLLHDVGKIFIPEEILTKPGMLTPDERKTIETHTVKGARYLMGIDGIPKLAIIAALEHHRKFDGAGYPAIKGGWTPNIISQMISVADVFDAMRSKRAYQGAIPLEKIVDVLRKGSGTSFNPQLVDHFLRLIRYQGAA